MGLVERRSELLLAASYTPKRNRREWIALIDSGKPSRSPINRVRLERWNPRYVSVGTEGCANQM